MEWRKIETEADLPKKPGKQSYEIIHCLIVHNNEVILRAWNCEHECWDDEYGDDYFCDKMEPTHWMPLPQPPKSEDEQK